MEVSSAVGPKECCGGQFYCILIECPKKIRSESKIDSPNVGSDNFGPTVKRVSKC